MHHSLIALFLLFCTVGSAQVVLNVSCSSPEVVQVMKGLHDPTEYAASDVIDDHGDIICALRTAINADSLRSMLERLTSFGTRHSYSDTVSNMTGIGAARRWAFSRFDAFGAANEGRLIPAYLSFDNMDPGENTGCGSAQDWKNVFAVLPGRRTENHQTVFLMAHLDSRCADNCDPVCDAQGAEDNGSGCALVLELARVMSRYTFDQTLVFVLTTAEEQGLLGAQAMADFCSSEGVAIRAVLNNDVIGGIQCGETASPPGCVIPGAVDSLNMRIFSIGNTAARHRSLARSIKLFHQEKLQNEVPVHMSIEVMSTEDRVGRGGDHIPFRAAGFSSVRFTAANEHGDGDPSEEGYDDRQHTSADILGLDTDGDLLVDSFFVDFNYLQRNATINGMAATLLGLGPDVPQFELLDEPTGARITFDPSPGVTAHRVGVRPLGAGPDIESIYRATDNSFLIPGLNANGGYYISAAAIDANGITGPFSSEILVINDMATPIAPTDPLDLGLGCAPIGLPDAVFGERTGNTMMPCHPNPSASYTTFDVLLSSLGFKSAFLEVNDALGRVMHRIPVVAGVGRQEIRFDHSLAPGIYPYRLVVDGRSERAMTMVVVGN